jgi:hypothetical protein
MHAALPHISHILNFDYHQFKTLNINLEASAVTEFNERFTGRQLRQNLKVYRRFGK